MGCSVGRDLAHNVISATIIEVSGTKRIVDFPKVVQNKNTMKGPPAGRILSGTETRTIDLSENNLCKTRRYEKMHVKFDKQKNARVGQNLCLKEDGQKRSLEKKKAIQWPLTTPPLFLLSYCRKNTAHPRHNNKTKFQILVDDLSTSVALCIKEEKLKLPHRVTERIKSITVFIHRYLA